MEKVAGAAGEMCGPRREMDGVAASTARRFGERAETSARTVEAKRRDACRPSAGRGSPTSGNGRFERPRQ